MDIVSVALKRYSTKAFDATKKLTAGGSGTAENAAAVQPV